MLIKIKDNANLKKIEELGFKKNGNGIYIYVRELESKIVWIAYITRNHRYVQIRVYEPCQIAGSLQVLIYKLTEADLVECVNV